MKPDPAPAETPKQPKSGSVGGVRDSYRAAEAAMTQLRPQSIPAFIASLVLHLVLLMIVAVTWKTTSGGTGEVADRSVGIALVHRMPDRDRYTDPAETVVEESDQSSEIKASAASAAAPPANLKPPVDLAGILESLQATPLPVSGNGMAGTSELGDGDFGTGRNQGSSADPADATTMVFGVSGTGSRFVYVFDRSDSMNGYGGKPLRAAKRELLRSLRSLTDKQRFQLIFYNDKPTPMRLASVPLQMLSGEESNVLAAEQYVNSIAAFGGTEHEPAIKMALRMAPDVIFLLTDARIPSLPESKLREIQIQSERSGTTIHAIEFGSDAVAPSDSFLRELAAMNRGQYQYVNVGRL